MDDVKSVLSDERLASGSFDVAVSLHAVGWWVRRELMVLSVDALLVYLKVLHFLAEVPYISNLLTTLVRARLQLLCFLVVLTVLVLAFASAFTLAVGTQLADWHTLGQSMLSLLRFTLGDVDVRALIVTNPAIGALLYLLFLFLCVFVSVSIFLAIITEAYAAERKRAAEVDLFSVVLNAGVRQWRRTAIYRTRIQSVLLAPLHATRWLTRRGPPLDDTAPLPDADATSAKEDDGSSFKLGGSLQPDGSFTSGSFNHLTATRLRPPCRRRRRPRLLSTPSHRGALLSRGGTCSCSTTFSCR